MKTGQFKMLLISFIITIAVIVVAALFVWRVVWPEIRDLPFLQGFGPNRNVEDFHRQFNLNPNDTIVIFNGEWLREDIDPIVERNGGDVSVFLPAGFLRERIDPFLFWDEGAGVFFISTRTEMAELTPGSREFLVNDVPRQLSTPIRRVGNEIYLPIDLLGRLYPWIIEYRPLYNKVVITDATEMHTVAQAANANTAVRYFSNNRSSIGALLEAGDRVFVFEDGESGADGEFVRVRTEDGLLGYTLHSDLHNFVTAEPSLSLSPVLSDWVDNTYQHPPDWSRDVRINLAWELVDNQDANRLRMEIPMHPSVNVISPKWFHMDASGERINSIANQQYIDWAQSQGVYVWPLVFDAAISNRHDFLPNRDSRRHVINQLLNYVDTLGLDWLNIDFEHLTPMEGLYKIQFLRELAIPMRQRGATLSAAVLPPIPATAFYRRDLIGLTVDFVMVMTYDEHWSTSPIAGPNASLPWVQRAIDNMLLEVPREKLVMGIPLYVTMWREVVRDGALSTRQVGMNLARSFFEERGVEWEWDSEVGSYFGEVAVTEENEAVIWRTWLEDERSIRAKMQLFAAYDLAGVASWHRVLGSQEAWAVIGSFFQ